MTEQLTYRLDAIERAVAELCNRVDSQFRWLVSIQITTLIALGSLLFSILSKLALFRPVPSRRLQVSGRGDRSR